MWLSLDLRPPRPKLLRACSSREHLEEAGTRRARPARGGMPLAASRIPACQAFQVLGGQVPLAPPRELLPWPSSHCSRYRANTYLTDRCRDGPFLIPDVIVTSVPASSGSPHAPGTAPNALSHLPTPAAPSSESHTYLSPTTRPTPTALHVTNRPRPANDSSHSSPHPCGPNGSCC